MLQGLGKRALLWFTGVLVGVGLGELMMRVAWAEARSPYPEGLFVADADAGYVLRSDYRGSQEIGGEPIELHTNSLGLRDGSPRDDVDRTILVLGDSFTFGHGVDVEDNLTEVLEGRLQAGGEARVEVVNAGVPGYSTWHARKRLEQLAEPLSPDVVVLGFYVGNDFRDNYTERFGRLVASSGRLVPRHEGDGDLWLDAKTLLFTRSRLAQFLYTMTTDKLAPEDHEAWIQHLCRSMEWDPGFSVAMLEREWSADAQGAWEATCRELADLERSCEERGLPLVVVLYPGPYQYEPGYWGYVLDECGCEPAQYDLDKPNRRMREFCAERGLLCVDLLPRFREATAEGVRLYRDVHFNPAGHELAAEELEQALRAAGFLGS